MTVSLCWDSVWSSRPVGVRLRYIFLMEIEIEINVKFKLIRLIDWNSIIDLAKFITRI